MEIEQRIVHLQERQQELLAIRSTMQLSLVGDLSIAPLPSPSRQQKSVGGPASASTSALPGPGQGQPPLSAILRKYAQDPFPWTAEMQDAAHVVWGIDSFRPLQLDIMNATMDGQDVVVIMSTGSGTSPPSLPLSPPGLWGNHKKSSLQGNHFASSFLRF